MAKGSVRKKGKKWYYRFYVEDASEMNDESALYTSSGETPLCQAAHMTSRKNQCARINAKPVSAFFANQ